jgi:endonuclease-8
VPEGDNIHALAARLHAALAGQTLRRADFRVPALATADLSGHAVSGAAARGKHLLVRTDRGMTIHSHLELDGAWELFRPGERWRGPAFEIRVVLETDPWTAVGYRIPVLEVLPTHREAERLAHLGPDVLGPDWDPKEALRRLEADPVREVGVALIDQRVMAGPGNVYKCEALFLRGIHPGTPVGGVDDLAALVGMVKRLMEANRHRPARVTTGDTHPGRRLWVYGRAGRPCLRCGTPVRTVRQGSPPAERVTYLCPSCQPERS